MDSTRSRVLKELEQNKGQYVSGEALAESCGVSRNAIWKSIGELRKDGYAIDSQKKKGYMLPESSDIISREGISLYLTEELSELIYVYDTVDSTNMEAKRFLTQDRPGCFKHGITLVAKSQTAGQGHNNTEFKSPEGGIYLSVIMNPGKTKLIKSGTGKNQAGKNQTDKASLPDIISERVKVSLEKVLDVRLTRNKKGGIYQKNKKICGILTEGIVDMETGIFSNYIVGVGIRFDEIENAAAANKNMVVAEIIESVLH